MSAEVTFVHDNRNTPTLMTVGMDGSIKFYNGELTDSDEIKKFWIAMERYIRDNNFGGEIRILGNQGTAASLKNSVGLIGCTERPASK